VNRASKIRIRLKCISQPNMGKMCPDKEGSDECAFIFWGSVARLWGLAMLARSLGHEVTGSDANVYPPMSTLLENQGLI
jgi:hypothetical protein